MGLIERARVYSPWLYHLHCGGCNGCDIEILAALSPRFDVERFGIQLVPSPRQADILLTTGCVPKQITPMLRRVYEQTPQPKVVVAVGSCACGGSLFYDENPENYAIVGAVDRVIPVDVYVPGCAPKPEAIINGIVQSILKLAEKHEGK
ncbi:MAG: NADH-quinone oxidoreductase subunit B family protein [Candidatus Methanomethylicaceae archaeon]